MMTIDELYNKYPYPLGVLRVRHKGWSKESYFKPIYQAHGNWFGHLGSIGCERESSLTSFPEEWSDWELANE